MQRKRGLLTTIILLAALLAACASGPPIEQDSEKIDQFNRLDDESNELEPSDEGSDPSILGLQAARQTGVTLYFLDEATGQLSPEVRRISGRESNEELVSYILKELTAGPETSNLSPVVPENVTIHQIDFNDNILTVDLSAEFNESPDLALARAALVNSLLDMGSFKYVKLYIDGNEATTAPDDKSGSLGLLTRYPVVVAEIKALEEQNGMDAKVRKIYRELYFQDNSGQYLLPEVRLITIKDGNAAEAIVNELMKGPAAESEGYYPVLPQGAILHSSEMMEGQNEANGIALFFSKEFNTQLSDGAIQGRAVVASLVYSLTSLPDIQYVKIFYDNGKGHYIDDPIDGMVLNQNFTIEHFSDMVGKRIRVYYGNDQSMLLVPEYRAIGGKEENLASRILAELATDPVNPDSVRVIPSGVSVEDIHLDVVKELAVVDVPAAYFDQMELDNKKMIRDLYAVVNTLTDPINGTGIKEVQFTVEGKIIDSYMDISLKESFVLNPALNKQE